MRVAKADFPANVNGEITKKTFMHENLHSVNKQLFTDTSIIPAGATNRLTTDSKNTWQ
jgi:hypothetical protein